MEFIMITHTNNCMAKSASEALSKMEDVPSIIGNIPLENAREGWRLRDKDARSLGGDIWFLVADKAYRVNSAKTRCDMMSYYPFI